MVRLRLPPLEDQGCDSYSVQVQTARSSQAGVWTGEWTIALSVAMPPDVSVASLDPSAAHRFRILATNVHGSGDPSDPSLPVLTDALHSDLAAPPEVSSTSSTSFALSWLGRRVRFNYREHLNSRVHPTLHFHLNPLYVSLSQSHIQYAPPPQYRAPCYTSPRLSATYCT